MKFIITEFSNLSGERSPSFIAATSEDGCVVLNVSAYGFYYYIKWTEQGYSRGYTTNFDFETKSWTCGVPPFWKEEYFKVVDKLLTMLNREEVIYA